MSCPFLFGFELDAAGVFVDGHRACDGQPLPGSLADLLGRKERIEDATTHLRGNAGARILNANLYPIRKNFRLQS